LLSTHVLKFSRLHRLSGLEQLTIQDFSEVVF